jgi:putative glutamine amidotransferase
MAVKLGEETPGAGHGDLRGAVTARPRIVITPWRRALPTYLGRRTVLDALDPAYSDRVAEAGGFPLIVPRPPAAHVDALAREALALADGVLLSGGGDVDPTTYGHPSEDVDDADAAADAWEVALVRAAAQRRMPLLGICRGAQIMAVALGGSLTQRLAAETLHQDLAAVEPREILAERHEVELAPGSAMASLFGGRPVLRVNTIHHHAVADPGALEVTARAAGGLIEAVEPAGGWPALGVQWHPEKMDEPEQRVLFERLVDDARTFRDLRAGAT